MFSVAKQLVLAALVMSAVPQVRSRVVPIQKNLSAADSEFAWYVGNGMLRKAVQRPVETIPPDELAAAVMQLTEKRDAAVRFDVLRRASAAPADTFLAALKAVARATNGTDGDTVAGRAESIAAARARIARLDREDAAEATLELGQLELKLSSQHSDADWQALREGVIRDFPETSAARKQLVFRYGRVYPYEKQIAQLEEFARSRPKSIEAASAWQQIGFQLGTNMGTTGERGLDPTWRLLKAIEVATELETGDYPANEWSDQAASLVTGFFMSDYDNFAPGNIDRCLDAYRTFVSAHLNGDPSGRFAYLLEERIPDLCKRKNGGTSCVEDFVRALDAPEHHDGARYVAAMWHASIARKNGDATDPNAYSEAVKLFTDLAATGRGEFARRAQSELAALYLYERDYPNAAAAYRRLLIVDADNPWNWIVALRLGQALEASGDRAGAAAAYRDVLARGAGFDVAQVMGHEWLANLAERNGDLASALSEHRDALKRWDLSFGEYFGLVRGQRFVPGKAEPWRDDLSRAGLARRIDQLVESLSIAGGDRSEVMRRAVEEADWKTLRDVADRTVADFPGKPIAQKGLAMANRARLEIALDQYAAGDDAARTQAIVDLSALTTRQPADSSIIGARLAFAALQALGGDVASAKADTRKALDDWARHSAAASVSSDPLTRDVAQIRAAVFLPKGGGIYAEKGWNAFDWPKVPPPFLILNRSVSVRLASGDVEQITVPPSAISPGIGLWLLPADIEMLGGIVNRLGGTATRQPASMLETPNQPVGNSVKIVTLWNTFFPCRPGHWGGWEFQTYPSVPRIEFLDAARTKAEAHVVVGYSGATVTLEKRKGTWVATKIGSFWIT